VRRHDAPRFNAVHAFGFSASSYLVPDNPLRPPGLAHVMGGSRGALEEMREDPGRALSLHVIPRGPEGEPFTVTLPQRGFVHHVLNSFDRDDTTVLDAFVTNLDPERESSQFELGPDRVVSPNLGGVFRFEIERPTRRVTGRLLVPGLQRVTFDGIDERARGRAYRRAFFVANHQHEAGSSEVVAADGETGAVARWSTGSRAFFRQPRFVPAPDAEPGGAGWLLVPG
jgi:carotenoid cleavage dioxygenase-like enzyme